MKITVNGKITTLDPDPRPPTLENVLKLLGHNPLLIVVEFNGVILQPKHWKLQKVKDEDCLEIVTIVGGGS